MNIEIFNLRNSFLIITIVFSSFNLAFSQCPTVGAVITKVHTDISCFGAGDGTITVELGDGDAPLNFELYDNNLGTLVAPGNRTKLQDPDGDGNFRKVTFSDLYSSSFQVVVFKAGCTSISISETIFGTVVAEPAQLSASNVIIPDCDATIGVGNGSIDLSVSGGTAPYTIEWSGPTAIPDNTLSATNLDAGTYTATVTDANNCAVPQNIDIPVASMSNAGSDQSVCADNATLSANSPGPGETGTWSGPAGVTFSPNANAPDAVASNLGVGVNTLTWTITDSGGLCAGNSDQVDITRSDPALVNAGGDQSVCAGSSVNLNGTLGGTGTTVSWSGGTGSFAPGNTSLTAVYTPSAADIASGTVTLTLTSNDPDGAGPCIAATDQMVITINPAPTANAGADQTICADGTVTLAGAFAGAATSATWNGGGGTFVPNNSAMNAVYTPSAAEIAAGTVTITLTTNDPDAAGPCLPASDDVVITINALATVHAGLDQTICAGGTVILNGTRGGSATAATWTGGTGTFAPDANTLNAVYTPAAAEVTLGTVTLTLTTSGPCAPASDAMVITINPLAIVNAGTDQTICANGTLSLNGIVGGGATLGSWSGGGGTFAPDANDLNAVYTPSPAEITAGTVTLTLTSNDPDGAGPCVAASDNITITINEPAAVDAGPDQTICADGTIVLSGTRGGSATTATWTGGTGAFSPDNGTLGATYTPSPAEISAGSVTLTLTSNDPDGAGPCVAASDNVAITINGLAIVNAGADLVICADGTAALNGSVTGSVTTGTWSGGAGTFSPNASALNAVYTPSAAEIAAGTVALTLTSYDPDGAGPCIPVSDDITITITPTGSAGAGADQTICPDGTVALNGVIGGSAVAGTWSGGSGTFSPDAATLNATYTATAAEIASGSITLTLTATGGCDPVSDVITITIDDPSIAGAGSDAAICAGNTVALNGTVNGSAVSGTWSGGAGSFSPDNTTLNAIYTPAPTEIAAGTVTLTLTTLGPCTAAIDNVIITIQEPGTANAGTDQVICGSSTVSLNGSVGGSAVSGTWSGGSGNFSPDNASLNAVYTPSAAEILAGTVTLTLSTSGPCAAVSDDVIITIEAPATANAGPDQSICTSGTATLTGSTVGGTATTGAWVITDQPAGGDGALSDVAQTATPAIVTFTASVTGTYTLTLTTNDPTGICSPVTDVVDITVISAPTVTAGADQNICVGGLVTLAGAFTGTTGITWTTSGNGTFNDASLTNAIYTPGADDITNGTVTLTITTAGPCATIDDEVVITIGPAPTVDAGPSQTICATSSVSLNPTLGGTPTGLVWTSSGTGTFSDDTDPFATYTLSADDIDNGGVILTATTSGNCAGISDDVIIDINPAANIDAGDPQTICLGSTVTLNATFGGSATMLTWSSSGDGSFDDVNKPDAIYTPGTNDLTNGIVTLTAKTDNPTGPCLDVTDNVVITFIPIPGDQTTPGIETWIGYVYDDTGAAGTLPGRIDFDNASYRGFIESSDIDNMSAFSTYDVATDKFDLNLGLALGIQGPNVCGNLQNYFSVRYKMNKTFAAGVYRFTVGADDGVRLLIDGVNVIDDAAFDLHSYTPYTSNPVCLSAGVHSLEIQYFDNTAHSRLTFDYEEVPSLVTNSPVQVCINSPAPTLTVSSTDTAPDLVGFNWYKNGTLVFSGASYTPAGSELDMTSAATAGFTVTAVYACGETQPVDVMVEVLNAATLDIEPQTICESGGVVDLTTLIDVSPTGGTFTFSGHAAITGNNFDPSGLAGTTASVLVDYTAGSCTAPQATLDLTITNSATINAPATAVATCESSPGMDLSAFVSAVPAGGIFAFSGNGVTGNTFDPSGLSGIQTITVSYSLGGCAAPPTSFDMDVVTNASVTFSNSTACQNGGPLNLLTLATGTPSGGTLSFSGAGVLGDMFNPAGLSGTVNIDFVYDFNGCTDNGTIQITVLHPTDPLCMGGNCSSVIVVPMTEPATCTNSDGRLVMNLTPSTPAVNNTGVRISINGTSSTGLPISFTIHNSNTFENLPVGLYNYSIEYGDPSCIKTGQFSIDQSGTVGTPVASNPVSPLCVGSATGSLTLDVPGETGNILEWSLDGGLTDPFKPFTAGGQITGIPAGPSPSYQRVISVRRNISDVCYSSVTVVIPEAVQNISATFVINPATCNGNDGAITNIVANGGNGAPYSYSLDGGLSFQPGAEFNGLTGASYTLRVKDAAGCEHDFTASVTFPGFINAAISKRDADCSNGGSSGAVSVTIADQGNYEVAISTDPNQPAETEYQAYGNSPVTFTELPRGQYYVYTRSNSGGCPTRSAPINVFGVYAITFDLQADCNRDELSLALVNVTGDANGAPMEIQVSKQLSSDPPEIIYKQFPANGEIYLDFGDYNFLKTPGEYRIKVIQFQSEVVCNFSSGTIDFIVPEPMAAHVASVSESYPDIPTGELQVGGFSGGLYPYSVRIELDSASSFALPYHLTNFEEAGLNRDQRVEMLYKNIPAGRYQVEVVDSIGCSLDLIARVPLDVDLYIPNVFTPNGDGSNDVFFIRNLPPAPSINQLIISNRWGKEVFASDNYQNNWDGEGAADGLYFYRLQFADNQSATGWIEIMRGQKP